MTRGAGLEDDNGEMRFFGRGVYTQAKRMCSLKNDKMVILRVYDTASKLLQVTFFSEIA